MIMKLKNHGLGVPLRTQSTFCTAEKSALIAVKN